MQIRSIELRNFKGLSKLKFQLSPGFNILSSSNEEDKTSILQSFALGLHVLSDHFLLVSASFDKERDTASTAKIEKKEKTDDLLEFNFGGSCTIEMNDENHQLSISRVVDDSEKEETIIVDSSADSSALERKSENEFPIFAFYRSSRFLHCDWIETVRSSRFSNDTRCSVYESWQDAGNAESCSSTLSWIREKTSVRLDYAERGLDATPPVENDGGTALSRIVNDAFPEIVDVCWDRDVSSVLVSKEIKGKLGDFRIMQIPFEMLSDGERSVIMLFADILRRMCVLHPHLKASEAMRTDGIVLIDDLEAHLHPDWQRRILKGLRRAFPRVQFIAATNSPIMIGEVEPNGVHLLDGGKIVQPVQSYGLDVNEVLEQILHTERQSIEVKEAVGKIKELIEIGKTDEARNRLNALEEKLNGSIRSTRDADAAISFKESILKE
ncbi:hypothetical protein FG381_01385 [Sutterella faecalis]|uniref:AAA family ATPase n=2 Tax=Sutterella TaxID=40544 RepID=A0AAI9WN43_9BURK|nr:MULTISPECIES: AAA family ATPase [Sutterella]KAB7651725.1 AAA family ATPase [Sutterella seckii]QDA53701.1 hypothetical protein FG381_01385 [Sutterella faecalis]